MIYTPGGCMEALGDPAAKSPDAIDAPVGRARCVARQEDRPMACARIRFFALVVLLIPVGALANQTLPTVTKADMDRLTVAERVMMECVSGSGPGADNNLAMAYLFRRGLGPLARLEITASVKQSLLTSGSELIFQSESTCALTTMPKADGDIGPGVLSKTLVDAGLADRIIRDAKRYIGPAFDAGSSFGIAGKQGEVARAMFAYYNVLARGQGERIEGLGPLKFMYYMCRTMHSEATCMTPVARTVLATYPDR